MATLAESLVSSASRPLTLRMRPDLTARRQRYHGQSYWVVKEPIGLNYFRFHEEEYAILCMLDGRSSLESIKERFEQEFMPQKITFQDLQQFVGMLHRSGLVVADAIGQGQQLRKRRDEKKRREMLGKLSNVFAFRWRGIDPEWILNWLYPFTRWFFTRPAVIFNVLLACAALLLVTVQFDVFRSRLPSFHQFFGNWENWLVMGIVMAGGQGAARVRARPVLQALRRRMPRNGLHAAGVHPGAVLQRLRLLDAAQQMASRGHRRRRHVRRDGAGVDRHVHLVVHRRTTLLNQICLSVMFICSVSTMLFNGNPLLRFDGYYILMDLIEIPNLRQKSTEVLKRFMVQLCLGIEQPENPFLPQRNRFLFGLYTVAAVIYRWIVVFSILLFLNKVLEPYGLKIIGRIVGLAGLFGLVVQPMWQLAQVLLHAGEDAQSEALPGHRVAGRGGRPDRRVPVRAAAVPRHAATSMSSRAMRRPSMPPWTDAWTRCDVEPGQSCPSRASQLARLENVELEVEYGPAGGRTARTGGQDCTCWRNNSGSMRPPA